MPHFFTAAEVNETSNRQLLNSHVDVTGAEVVEVSYSRDAAGNPVLWLNVNGICLARVCRINVLMINGDQV